MKLAAANKIRLLAAPSAKRDPVIPDVSTTAEPGFGAELDLFHSQSVPKGTPDEIKAKLANAPRPPHCRGCV